MTYTQICDKYENQYRISNNVIFKNFLGEFCSEIDIHELAREYGVEESDYTNLFWTLHSYLFNHMPQSIPLFYQMLERYHYNINADCISLIGLAGHNTKNELKPIVKEFLKKAPFIDNVTDSNGKLTIHSEKLGNISFYSIRRYFQNDFLIGYLLDNFPAIQECHNISWKLTKKLPGSTLITSLIPQPFEGTCYHTFVRDKNGMIVDASNGCVFEESTFHQVFQDEMIVETKANDLEKQLGETSLLEARSYPSALVLALHEQKKKL